MSKCKQCNKEYESKRSTSRYCSGQCRKLAFQNGNTENAKENAKRGQDIQCFADLPPDVQQVIISMSTTEGKLDESEKTKRTTSAIKYQHLFPDRYEPQAGLDADAIVTGLPGDPDYDGVCLDAKYDSHRIKV